MIPHRKPIDDSPGQIADLIVVLFASPRLHEIIRAAAPGHRVIAASDAGDQLSTILGNRPAIVIVDRTSRPADADAALHRLGDLTIRPHLFVMVVDREATSAPARDVDVVVLEPVLAIALEHLQRTPPVARATPAYDGLLGTSLLTGPLDQALQAAADQLADGFGVDRCLISIRGDSAGGAAATGTRTWSQLGWSQTAARCHAAVAAEATLVAPSSDGTPGCESFLAVPLVTSHGAGFAGLVIAGPALFGHAERGALLAAAGRFTTELGWRSKLENAAEELDRIANGPGLDRLLGTWNRTALKQLTGMLVSGSRRAKFPLSVAVLELIDLHTINTRHGLAVGDRVLRVFADVVKSCVRDEDIVGRLAGDELAVVLHGTSPEGAERVAERVLAALEARPIEIASGGSLAIRATAGIAALDPNEGAIRFLARAARAATTARETAARIAVADRSGPTSSPGLRLGQQVEDVDSLAMTLGGAYRLIHEISRGGMGVVYRATDLALERPVAIKMLRPDLAEDPALVHRFRVEATMLAQLQHPHLVQVYSFGHSGGDTYFVMELVEGESLDQAMHRHRNERTAMPLAELATTLVQVGSALDALHDRGIVHRDVKPANVIRDPFRGRSVLVDVGIARRYGQNAESAGTPGYVAPEVIAHQDATPRSDVYGLAATAYAMLTLTPPWGDGDLHTLLARQRAGELAAPSTFKPELAPIDQILLAALHTDASSRPSSAGAFARRLSTALAEIEPHVLPGPRGDVSRPARRMTPTISPIRTDPMTRGVVFRSVPRALGVRDAARLRDGIGRDRPELSRALTQDTAPLTWLPTDLLIELLATAPGHVGRDTARFARDLARATVRASFRRFFPASSVTLVPERTLSAIRSVWARYHSWGTIAPMPVHATEVMVKLTDGLRDRGLCEWTGGMLEQLVVLSGGPIPTIVHEECASEGASACMFRVTWGDGG